MPPISKDQHDYCKLAQLSHALDTRRISEESIFKILTQTDDVNFKVLSNKSNNGYLIGGTPLHIVCLKQNSGLSKKKALEILLSRGADITLTNRHGYTPLHMIFHNMMLTSCNIEKIISLEDTLIQLLLRAHIDAGNIKNPRSSVGLSHFHIACASNYMEVVQLFLNSGVSLDEAVNVESKIFPGYTPLHFAVRFCSYETTKLLLERGADINAKDPKGLTPLHLVIERNLNNYTNENEKIIMLFLEDSRISEVDEEGFSKFHAACTLSDTSLVERFMKDVDVNCAINMDSPMWPGYAALHFAAHFHIEIVKLLLKNGADIEAQDLKGMSPFDLCTEKYSVEDLYDILSAIPAFGDILFSDNVTKLSDFVVAMRTHSTLEVFLQSTPKDVYLPNNSTLWAGYCLSHVTVLFSKSASGYWKVSNCSNFRPIETYLSCGGNAIIRDAHGRSPLHLAFYQRRISVIDQFFKCQLGLVDMVDSDGLSHLHIACERKNYEAMRTLLSQGANVNGIYKGDTLTSGLISGSTPLHIVMKYRKVDILKLLLEYGPDANVTDAEGMTPLHRGTYQPPWCSENGKIKEIGNALFASYDLKNAIHAKTGLSHLHFACFTANTNAVEGLMKLGANPNAEFSGVTPMDFAVRNRSIRIIQLLLQGGGDILRKNANGTTPIYEFLSSHNVYYYYHRYIYGIMSTTTRTLTSTLINDVELHKRAEEDCGLTLLHIACFVRDANQVRSLLDDPRVDVNAQMHADSPLWPKATPLHVFFYSCYEPHPDRAVDLEELVRMLLDAGANVMLTDHDDCTSVLKAYRNLKNITEYHCLRLMLRCQKEFCINPVNEEGLSHFHLACAVSEYTIVEKFLKSGVDVNQPIDYRSYCQSMIFHTPLQFMLRSRQLEALDVESHLKTIDVLLKYGVDVNAQDEKGSTPFLEVVRFAPSRVLFFKKLLKAGADINCTTIHGQSALEILLDNSNGVITTEELQIILNNPNNHFNSFNLVNGIGVISKIIEKQHHESFLKVIMENPSLFTTDSMGRTPIHNMVSNHQTFLSQIEYANYIERFVKMGYNIDAQDSTGETALHKAAHFHNEIAICGLLIAGADINVVDVSNRTAFVKLYESRNQRGHPVNTHLKTKINCYIHAMQLCGLEINSENQKLANSELYKWEVQLRHETILKKLEDTELVKIGKGSLTLRDFLSETGAVASRPSMMCHDREAVDNFFESVDYKRFPELSYLLKLQYRKMLMRLTLMEAATNSLKEILGSVYEFSMPDICCRLILRFLTNTDIKHLITSASMCNADFIFE